MHCLRKSFLDPELILIMLDLQGETLKLKEMNSYSQ